MSFLRPRAIQCVRASFSSPARQAIPTDARFLSQSTSRSADSPSMDDPKESAVKQEEPLEGVPEYDSPSYETQIDHGTSTFSPVPRHLMDGSEPGQVLPAAVLSGAPRDLQARGVRIFRPTKTATQSGDWHGHHWRMDWDILPKGHRWENPLMGWQSSADQMQGTHLNFKTKDDAILFAEKQGYPYYVQEDNKRRITPKAYANNFVHEPKKLKWIKTK